MSKCGDHLVHLNEYLDGDLEASLRAEIEEHIGECKNCRLMVDTLRRTVKLCREEGECEPLPQHISDKLTDAMRDRWQQKFGTGKK